MYPIPQISTVFITSSMESSCVFQMAYISCYCKSDTSNLSARTGVPRLGVQSSKRSSCISMHLVIRAQNLSYSAVSTYLETTYGPSRVWMENAKTSPINPPRLGMYKGSYRNGAGCVNKPVKCCWVRRLRGFPLGFNAIAYIVAYPDEYCTCSYSSCRASYSFLKPSEYYKPGALGFLRLDIRSLRSI